MADAFSLAVNILTVLDIGRKFAILAWDVYNDNKDGIPGIASLELTSKDLDENARQLGQLGSSSATHSHDETDERIQQLAGKCTEVAVRMQQTLRGISTHKMGHNKRSAVLTAFRFKWKENDIKTFQKEIEELRDELMLNLIISLRNGMKRSLHNQNKVIQEFAESRSRDESLKERLDHMTQQQEGFGQLIVEILSSNATSVVQSNSYSRRQASLEADLMGAMHSSAQKMEDEDVSSLQMPPRRLARVQNQFIGIFRYDSMFDREAGVTEAHPDTLKWIFKEPNSETHTWDHFGQWLESDDQLYWITGKMGSGKSTLMKYISEELPATSAAGRERRCTPYLVKWAKDEPLFIATFYFWAGSNEETKMQTSVEGLYRTLLTQILEVYPQAAPHVSPRRWENLCLFNKDSQPPGIAELKITFSKAIEYVSSMAKICLFIDGLDEFEGQDDDLQDLITWIKTLVETTRLKLCVASRPWRVFEDALQDRPHLLMEHFNFKDIQQYVGRRFHDDPNFRAKKPMEPVFCNQLLDEIVTKAEGVFLWVHLVCTRLLQAMSRGDLVGDLRRILNSLPVEMEKLYGNILGNIDLKDHAAQYFLLLQAYLGRPDALIFSFADDISEDIEFSPRMPKKSLTDAEWQYRVTELRKRLNSRCKGLLSLAGEVLDSRKPSAHSEMETIQYCHRSAKDYLTMDIVQKKLTGMLDVRFDPHLRLCSAHLARWKCCASDDAECNLKLRTSVYKCVEHAAKVASESCDMMIRILDDLGPDFGAQLFIMNDYFHHDRWFGGNRLSFTVVLGVREYVKCKVGQDHGCTVKSSSVFPNSDVWPSSRRLRYGLDKVQGEKHRMQKFHKASQGEKVEWPLLLDALLSAIQPDPEMVSLLLENGADPNLIVRCARWKASAMDVVLARAWRRDTDQTSPDTKKAWVDSLCLLLRHGAKPHRSNVQALRRFIGEDRVNALGLPHLGRHREFISKHLAYSKVDVS